MEEHATDGVLDRIDRIIFCTFLAREEETYLRLIPEYFPLAPDADFVKEWAALKADYASEAESETTESSSSEEEEEDEEEEEREVPPPPPPSKTEEVKEEKEEKKEEKEEEEEEEEEDNSDTAILFGKALLHKGEVEVEIPPSAKFEQRFEDFYYSLTPFGKFAPLYIKKGLKGGKFTIACNDATEDVIVHWTLRGESW
jgi:hypothetical protein